MLNASLLGDPKTEDAIVYTTINTFFTIKYQEKVKDIKKEWTSKVKTLKNDYSELEEKVSKL